MQCGALEKALRLSGSSDVQLNAEIGLSRRITGGFAGLSSTQRWSLLESASGHWIEESSSARAAIGVAHLPQVYRS